MPKTWYVKSANRINSDDSDENIAKKEFYNRICSHKKPYFFMYNYTNLKTEYDKYVKEADTAASILFGKNTSELMNSEELTEKEADFIENFYKYAPLDCSPSTINRICWAIEDTFGDKNNMHFTNFDYSILKTDVKYEQKDFYAVKKIYSDYTKALRDIAECSEKGDSDTDSAFLALESFKEACDALCLDEKALCNIVLDLCYTTNKSKQFAWDICGETIVNNLISKSDNVIQFPERRDDGDFEFKGDRFSMKKLFIGGADHE